MPLTATHELTMDSDNANRMTRAKQAESNAPKGARLETSDDPDPTYKIYIYNVLELEHEVNQPPVFPRFIVPARQKGERFSVTTLPAFIKERYERPGTNDFYYKRIDGRKYASQLMNPASFPGTIWKAQLQNWRSNDQFGNNLNSLGCFWSMLEPNNPALEDELQQFTAVAMKTMNELIRKAEMLFASGKQGEITPLQHFAMDLLRKQAPWHMQSDRMVDCPTCGEPVKEGIAYHRNSFGDKCPVDYAKCKELGIIPSVGAAEHAATSATTEIDPNDADAALEAAATVGAIKEKEQIKKKAGGRK